MGTPICVVEIHLQHDIALPGKVLPKVANPPPPCSAAGINSITVKAFVPFFCLNDAFKIFLGHLCNAVV